ncbi:MAG: PilZ domain-containing protein [Candidatus Omnitrophica bacterium]|nr:PilZ domain-containing protein [Candidatus Omnitrophota bacterium]MCM8770656.1 PilZ domain-containing protein [Candidatus Omnitrophota bacterium]
MKYVGKEKRRHPRFEEKLMVSYRLLDKEDVGVSQSKNISLSGMLLTTNKLFAPGTYLALDIRLPFYPTSINIIAEVKESKEVVKDEIFDTRLSFVSMDEKHKKALQEALDYYAKKKG